VVKDNIRTTNIDAVSRDIIRVLEKHGVEIGLLNRVFKNVKREIYFRTPVQIPEDSWAN